MSLRSRRTAWWCWLFVMPNLVFFALFQGWPILANLHYAMLDWSGISTGAKFIGLDNYKELMQDPYFWKAYKHSFLFMFEAVPLLLLGGLVSAVLLNNPLMRLAKTYRTLLFIPVVTTASVIGIIMVYIWGSTGAVNYALLKLHLLDKPVNWLGDPHWAMFTVVMIYVWKNLGINMIYWLAGLQSIPRELYEAAKMDGAAPFKTFIHITVPLVAPVGLVILLLDVSGALKVFDMIKTMTDGGPFFATDVVSTYIYRYAFSSEIGLPRLGYASAAGIFFAFTIVLLAIAQAVIRGSFRSLGRRRGA
ncbi:multiple sugar transport system permease protein [Paenibacillus sacheonensis]|nr:multiple sugar transport system permease protein [Paenibacillus sacheonensis]